MSTKQAIQDNNKRNHSQHQMVTRVYEPVTSYDSSFKAINRTRNAPAILTRHEAMLLQRTLGNQFIGQFIRKSDRHNDFQLHQPGRSESKHWRSTENSIAIESSPMGDRDSPFISPTHQYNINTSVLIQRKPRLDRQIYRGWIDDLIRDWQITMLDKIQDWCTTVLIHSLSSRTRQLNARLAKVEHHIANPKDDTAMVFFAFLGDFLSLIGVDKVSKLIKAARSGFLLYKEVTRAASQATEIPQFVDEMGGLQKVIEDAKPVLENQFAFAAEGKRRKGRKALSEIYSKRGADDTDAYRTMMDAAFPELPASVRNAQVPTAQIDEDRELVPENSNFIQAVRKYAMDRVRNYLSEISTEARKNIKDMKVNRASVPEGLTQNQVNESEMRALMAQIGIAESAERLLTPQSDPPSDQRLSLLQNPLASKSWRVRATAALSLAKLTRQGKLARDLAIPELMLLLKDEEGIIRSLAAELLSGLNVVIAIPMIHQALQMTKEDKERKIIKGALRRLGNYVSRK